MAKDPVAKKAQDPTKPSRGYKVVGYSSKEVATLEPLCIAVEKLSKKLGQTVYLIVQNDSKGRFEEISDSVVNMVRSHRGKLPTKGKVALILNSSGGYADSAYRIATCLQHACGGFDTYVPLHAKSAATLLALGSSSIYLSDDGELGPIDAQIVNFEKEEQESALATAQSLERLQASAIQALDRTVAVLLQRGTHKKVSTIIPMAMKFVSELMAPLFSKIDVVNFTEMTRSLKIGEDYAVRLLKRGKLACAKPIDQIASALVDQYPDHGFVIDREEAGAIGIKIRDVDAEISSLLADVGRAIGNLTIVGMIEETDVPLEK